MNILPAVLLVVALILFWISTRQMHLYARLAILAAATVLLAAAAYENVRSTYSTGLLSSLFRHPDIVADAFTHNWRTVGDALAPALDILLAMTGLLCVGCFIALTPGERIERVIRPINIALIGAIVGGAIVLAISAVGFGPTFKRQVFIAYVDASDVVDGDTIRMGDVGLRLSGIDAPEDHQICLRADGRPFDCGHYAAEVLRKLAIPGPVFCRSPQQGPDGDAEQLRESFGRPLVACGSDEQGYGGLPDIGRELVRMGYAFPYQSPDGVIDSPYVDELAEARARKGRPPRRRIPRAHTMAERPPRALPPRGCSQGARRTRSCRIRAAQEAAAPPPRSLWHSPLTSLSPTRDALSCRPSRGARTDVR